MKKALFALALLPAVVSAGPDLLDLGSRRELLVDRFLIDSLQGIGLLLHEPRDEGEVFRFDRPWEGAFCGYSTVIQEGGRFRLYYRGKTDSKADGIEEVTCYAESQDGRHWDRPKLGLFALGGSKDNNVILTESPYTHNFSPFLDRRPGVPEAERFKALGGTMSKKAGSGLVAFGSPDGIHWSKMKPEPVITKGAFDSQNVSFWSELEQCYVCYFRTFTAGKVTREQWTPAGLRSVSRVTSRDFLNWGEPESMRFEPPQQEHIYVSQTHPYFRAPHLYLATAVRFLPGRKPVSDEEAKQLQVVPAYFQTARDATDVVLMTSRGGNCYDRTFREALVRPGLRLAQWVSRSNYPTLNVVQTGPAEMSFYANTDYAQPTAHLRRYSMRLDGFASAHAGYDGGELRTKRLTFTGNRLLLNFSTSAAGGIRVEIQDEGGNAFPGFALADSVELMGDAIERPARWKGGEDVSSLAGKPVRLRFGMKEADLFSLQFAPLANPNPVQP